MVYGEEGKKKIKISQRKLHWVIPIGSKWSFGKNCYLQKSNLKEMRNC